MQEKEEAAEKSYRLLSESEFKLMANNLGLILKFRNSLLLHLDQMR